MWVSSAFSATISYPAIINSHPVFELKEKKTNVLMQSFYQGLWRKGFKKKNSTQLKIQTELKFFYRRNWIIPVTVYWMNKMSLAVGKRKGITKDSHGLENQEEGIKVLRGHLSLSLLNLPPIFPYVGSFKILQYFFNKFCTLQYTASAIYQIMPDASSVSCWKITILSNCNTDFRLF